MIHAAILILALLALVLSFRLLSLVDTTRNSIPPRGNAPGQKKG